MQPYFSEQFEAFMAEEKFQYQCTDNFNLYEFGVTAKNGSWFVEIHLKHA